MEELVVIGPAFAVDRVALVGNGENVTLEKCEVGLDRLCTIMDGIRYWRGDLMNLTEGLFAEEASQIIDHERLTEAEAKAEMFVASHVAPSTRAQAPSWEHARVVAKLTPTEQAQWLQRARIEQWSARKLGTEIAQAANDGKTVLRWTLVVDCGTEARMEKLSDYATSHGYGVLKAQGVPRKVPKPKKAVTAKGKGKAKMSATRRAPQ